MFKDYFRENVRAAHGLTHGDDDADELDEACCNFIGSKLEPGATMSAYQNLSDDIKNDWEDLEEALEKLRRHCKRDKMNINVAFQFAVDYEASEFEENGKELAANRGTHLAAAAASTAPIAASSSLAFYDIEPEIEANRRDIEELQIGQALLDDRVTRLHSDMKAGFQHLESLIVARANAGSQSNTPSTDSAATANQPPYAATA